MTRDSGTGTEATWVLPDEPVAVRLMNTIWADRRGVHDALRTPQDLAGWLVATGLSAGPTTDDPNTDGHTTDGHTTDDPNTDGHTTDGHTTDGHTTDGQVEAFRDLRDALRRLAALLTDDPRPAAASPLHDPTQAVEAVNRAVDAGPASPRLRLRGGLLERDDTPAGPTGALALVARQAVLLLTGSQGKSLNACHAPGCVLYYVKDHPRRGWCSTTCGNRARAARHYQRQRESRAQTQDAPPTRP